MEKIVYSERIRELADILARKLVVRKAKNLWATAMQHTKNALAVDYSAAMDVSRDCMLSHVRRYQKEENVLGVLDCSFDNLETVYIGFHFLLVRQRLDIEQIIDTFVQFFTVDFEYHGLFLGFFLFHAQNVANY